MNFGGVVGDGDLHCLNSIKQVFALLFSLIYCQDLLTFSSLEGFFVFLEFFLYLCPN